MKRFNDSELGPQVDEQWIVQAWLFYVCVTQYNQCEIQEITLNVITVNESFLLASLQVVQWVVRCSYTLDQWSRCSCRWTCVCSGWRSAAPLSLMEWSWWSRPVWESLAGRGREPKPMHWSPRNPNQDAEASFRNLKHMKQDLSHGLNKERSFQSFCSQ